MSNRYGRVIGVLSLLVIVNSCGGGSSGAGGQACQTYAAAFCKRIYACTPTEMQDADFHDSYGSSEAQCAQQETLLCNATLPAGQTALGTNCSGGKHVNMAALTVCEQQLNSAVCASFLEDPYQGNNCADVCVTSTTGAGSGGASGSGGMSGTGGASGSGGSSGGSGALAFCKSSLGRLCELTFQCTPEAERDATFIAEYGTSVNDCKSLQEASCTSAMCTYNATAAAACQSALNAATCDNVVGVLTSTSCQSAC